MNLTENEKKMLLLLSREEDYKPAKYFSSEMKYSSKTLYQICTSISEKFMNEFNKEIISKVPRHGIKLLSSYNDLKEQILKDGDNSLLSENAKYSREFRKIYMLLDLLINGKVDKLEYYIETFYVADTTIQKDYMRLFKLLDKNGIEVTKNGLKETSSKKSINNTLSMVIKKIVMESAEKNVVHYNSYIKLYSDVKEDHYYYSLFLTVKYFCDRCGLENDATLQNHHLDSLILSVYFYLLSRSVTNEEDIHNMPNFSSTQLNQLEWYIYVLEFTKDLHSEYGMSMSQKDVQKICHLLVMHGFDFTYAPGDEADKRIEVVIEQLIYNMSHYLDIDLNQNLKLKKSLFKHIVPMIKRLQNDVYIKNPIINSVKKQYSSVFQLISVAVGDIENTFNIILNEDENAFLTIHFQVAIESELDMKHILVVCKQGLLTSELIYNKLNKISPKNSIIEIITSDQLKQIENRNIDLIVSSVKLESMNYPVCYVSILPSNDEIKRVVETIFDLDTNKRNRKGADFSNDSVLSQFISKENIFLKKKYKNIEEIFLFLALEFKKRNLSEIDINQELSKREQLGYTSLNTGIAIPHVAPYLIKESTVMFITLDKPIQWGQNKVSLILFLALKQEDVSYAKGIIEEIQEVIESTERIDAISTSLNFENFKEKLLSREGDSCDV